MARISVITATLNRPSLKETCESVDNQSYRDWHHYVIGDGTLPLDYVHPQRTTIGFTRSIGAEEPGANMPNGTPNPILRWALQHLSLAEFVCFLDDDNIYESQFLQVMLDTLLANPDAGIAICAVSDLRYRRILNGYPAYGHCDNSGFLVYSHIAKGIGFPRASPDREVNQDCEFIESCAERYGWVRVPERLVVFGANPNIPPLRGHAKFLESWELPLQGAHLARLGRYKDAIARLTEAVSLDPKDAWALWHLGEVLFLVQRKTDGMEAWSRWLHLLHAEAPMPCDWIQFCSALVYLLREDAAEAQYALGLAIQRGRVQAQNSPGDLDKVINMLLYTLVAGQVEVAKGECQKILLGQPSAVELNEAIWMLNLVRALGLEIVGVPEILDLLQGCLLQVQHHSDSEPTSVDSQPVG